MGPEPSSSDALGPSRSCWLSSRTSQLCPLQSMLCDSRWDRPEGRWSWNPRLRPGLEPLPHPHGAWGLHRLLPSPLGRSTQRSEVGAEPGGGGGDPRLCRDPSGAGRELSPRDHFRSDIATVLFVKTTDSNLHPGCSQRSPWSPRCDDGRVACATGPSRQGLLRGS